jgi:formate hydrogenlyase subunit 3/multisubunit Na+/H+ antiporter MnhD subunit
MLTPFSWKNRSVGLEGKLLGYLLWLGMLVPTVGVLAFWRGHRIEKAAPWLSLVSSALVGLSLLARPELKNEPGLPFAVLAVVVWTIVLFYSQGYMAHHEHGRTRFYRLMLLDLSVVLGLFVAADWISFALFFLAAGVINYTLIVHEGTEAAVKASHVFVTMQIAAVVALFVGIGAVVTVTHTATIVPALEALSTAGVPAWLPALGFGAAFAISAALFPLFIWLPAVDPIAPAPVSALLCGVAVKIGVYGFFRLFMTVLVGPGEEPYGELLLGLALVAMVFGAGMALFQDNLKRLLAYSTVSQVGYILSGLGAALVFPEAGMLGVSASLFHIMNHAVFKAALFMLAGEIAVHTGSLSLRALGGLRKRMPVTAIVFALAGLSAMGIPLLSGFGSKTMLHEAVLEATRALPGWFGALAPWLFTLGSVGTAAYMLRLYFSLFFGEEQAPALPETREERGIFILLAVLIVTVGLVPTVFAEHVVLPAAAGMASFLETGAEAFHAEFFHWEAIWPVLQAVLLGLVLFVVLKMVEWRRTD